MIARLALSLFAVLLSALPAHAESVADFYRGKSIQLLIAYSAGGNYDLSARLLARHMGKHSPGNPPVVPQNFVGAAGLRLANFLYKVAPKDGTTIGMVHSSVPFAPLYGIEGAKFDPRRMHWIGSLDASTGICVAWHTSPIKTFQDMLEREFTVGGSGAGSHMETLPAMINRLFGTRMKIVSGYKGGNAIYLAMERGEVEGRCGGLMSSIASTRPDWFPQKKINIPIQIALERSSLIPDAPALGEFAKDARTRQVLQLFTAPERMDRPILAPPGVPAERVAELRQAFHAAMNDPGFIADAARQHLHIQEIDGDRVAQILADAYALPAEVVNAINDNPERPGR
jgi:tripartite-type tricarboxylate transporter receptor subunit TctC